MNKEVKCPSCGRYVGPYFTCPYCGASVNKRLSLKFLKYASIILAFLGLGYLYYVAKNIKAPLMKISQIQKTMNFAIVRIKGKVIGNPFWNTESKSFSFKVNDGSGNIWVSCYSTTAKQLIKHQIIPLMGYKVEVEGPLRVRKSGVSMTLNYWQKLKILSRPQIEYKGLPDKMSELKIGKGIEIEGKIISSFTNQYVSSYYILTPKNKKIALVIPQFLKVVYQFPKLQKGDKIKVKGIVNKYKKNYQIIPFSPQNIVFISKFSSSIKNNPTNLSGEQKLIFIVEKTTDFGKGVVLKGKITTGKRKDEKIKAIIWKNETQKPIPLKGDLIEAKGKFQVYKGNLQFKIQEFYTLKTDLTKIPFVKLPLIKNYIKHPIKTEGKITKIEWKKIIKVYLENNKAKKTILNIPKKDFLRISNNALLKKGTIITFVAYPVNMSELNLLFPSLVKFKKGDKE